MAKKKSKRKATSTATKKPVHKISEDTPGEKPRGFYTEDLSWAKDKTFAYFQGTTLKIIWPTVKVIALVNIFLISHLALGFPHYVSLSACLVAVLFYQDVVAMVVPNTIKMGPMDHQCYLSSTKAHVNYMNVSQQDVECGDGALKNFTKLFKKMPKLRYKVKEICGDYYYEMMSVEETMQKAFLKPQTPAKMLKNKNEIDMFVRDNMNVKMPLDGPLWRLYIQKYDADDQEHLPEDLKTRGLTILKAHHSFCDGVSVMCMTLSLSEDYGRDYFVKSADAKWYEVIFVKFMALFTLPRIVTESIFAGQDQNYIARDKEMSGKTNVATSDLIDFRLLKALSKTTGITINDIVTSALSCSMNKLFKEHGDTEESFNLCIPANIRFKFYPTVDDVKLENKFAALPLRVPLTEDMQSAYPIIKKATQKLKGSLSFIYGMYALVFWSNKVLPRFLPRYTVEAVSRQFTAAFSNTPGPIKPFFYYDSNRNQIKTISSASYVTASGKVGLNIAAMSFCNSFKVAICSDENIFRETQKLCGLIEGYIRSEIKRNNITMATYKRLMEKAESETKKSK